MNATSYAIYHAVSVGIGPQLAPPPLASELKSRPFHLITMLRRAAASRVGSALRVAGQRRSSQLAQAPAPEMAAFAMQSNPRGVRNNWSREEVAAIYSMPFTELLFRAASVHRAHWDPLEVQRCTLLSIKTGGCTVPPAGSKWPVLSLAQQQPRQQPRRPPAAPDASPAGSGLASRLMSGAKAWRRQCALMPARSDRPHSCRTLSLSPPLVPWPRRRTASIARSRPATRPRSRPLP